MRSSSASGVDDRQFEMTVDAGASMPRNMLDDRRDASGEQSAATARPIAATRPAGTRRRASRSPHAFGLRDIEHRRAIDIDADVEEIARHQPRERPAAVLGWMARSHLEAAALG